MRVVCFWEDVGLSLTDGNPYGALLARALGGLGVEMIAGYARDLDEPWPVEGWDSVDVLHLHWPDSVFKAPDLSTRISRCAKLVDRLAKSRSLGLKVVWTVHNLYPHESPSPDLDHLAQLAVARVATALIVHCEKARALVKEHFFRQDGVFVIPHGHFMDAYPNTVTREGARRCLGIPEDRFVYLFFGNVRPYKGLEQLLEVFSTMPEDDVTLLLAAKIYYEYGQRLVERAAQADSRLVFCPSRFYPNDDLQMYFSAADVAVFPFRDVLTSGSVITALSFGRPVILPRLGCLPELVDDSMGIIYDPLQPDGLKHAMKAIRDRDLTECGSAARRRAESLSWESIAELTLEAYQY